LLPRLPPALTYHLRVAGYHTMRAAWISDDTGSIIAHTWLVSEYATIYDHEHNSKLICIHDHANKFPRKATDLTPLGSSIVDTLYSITNIIASSHAAPEKARKIFPFERESTPKISHLHIIL
jgi:hypothetical protein